MPLSHELLTNQKPNALDEERVKSIQPYEFSPFRVFLFIIASIVTIGLFPLLCYWLKKLFVFSTSRRTTNDRASRMVIVDEYNRSYICPIRTSTDGTNNFKFFSYKLLRFVFDEEINDYIPVEYKTDIPFIALQHEMLHGHKEHAANRQRALFGINSIEVPMKPWYRVLLEECLHPFFMFQVFSVTIWSINSYLPYAMTVLGMSIISVIMNMVVTMRNLKNIHEMSKQNTVTTIQRNGVAPTEMSSDQLVPGDVVHLRSGTAVPCDIKGDTTDITDKDAIDAESMDANLPPTQNMLFCHTQEILSGVEVDVLKRFDFSSHLQRMSVVVNRKTKEWSSLDVFVKGSPEIIKTLCKAKSLPDNFNALTRKYTKDGFRVIALATRRLGFTSQKESMRDINKPSLPVFLVDKLQRNDVEQNLTFLGLLVLENRLRAQSAPAITELSTARIKSVMVTGDNPLTAVHVAKGCGILNAEETVFLGDLIDGEVKWVCQDDESITLDPFTLLPRRSILGTIPAPSPSPTLSLVPNQLLSETQSMCSNDTNNTDATTMFLNGSGQLVAVPPTTPITPFPALIGPLPRPEQTIEKGTRKYGLAITGPAFTHLLAQEEERLRRLALKKEELAENSLNPNSRLSPLDFHSSPFSRIVYLCRVFARMSPDDKTHLIEKYIALGYTTGMCGDGANDCGALKAAHVGISLSEVEASIAAPFTSLEANISCVPELILEGRASLVTSFQAFKYMALYSLIQFMTVTLLLMSGADLSSWMNFVLDTFLVLPLAFTMSYTEPSKKLSPQSPNSALVSFPVLSTLFFHFGVFVVTQFTVFFLTIKAPWFNNEHPVEDPYWSYCIASLYMYIFTQFQYIWIAVVVNLSGKYKRNQLTNPMYTIVVIAEVIWALYCLFTPGNTFTDLILMYNEDKYNQPWGYQLKHRLILFGITIVSFVPSLIVEYLVVVWGAKKRATRAMRRKRSKVGDKNHIALAPKYQPKMKEVALPSRVTTEALAVKPNPDVIPSVKPNTVTPNPIEDETHSNMSVTLSSQKETESILHSIQTTFGDVTSLASWHAEFERDFGDLRDLEELKARLGTTRIFENMAGEVVWRKKKDAWSMKWKKEYHKIIWDLVEEDKDLKLHSN
ncbi:ion-transporting P-type ATPase [Blattamonas nauphoetae]|uniref:Cation-transporting ATPase n=1 Tax=Blattamonas nauphoetae TaxID=2049346 RepID=A0ABQ9X6Z7_9EUKA|nr:ion-transporting P-type ATPase [Blattamonas nauphoetae]